MESRSSNSNPVKLEQDLKTIVESEEENANQECFEADQDDSELFQHLEMRDDLDPTQTYD